MESHVGWLSLDTYMSIYIYECIAICDIYIYDIYIHIHIYI